MKLCRCGCKKTDHEDSYDWGKNKGLCKNCGWGNCEGFTEKFCAVKDCKDERESYFIFCKKHLDQDYKEEIKL